MLTIPSNFLSEFLKVSNSNFGKDGKLVETLAFLTGTKKEGGQIIGSHLIFPDQNGQAHHVDDKGKIKFFLDAKIS